MDVKLSKKQKEFIDSTEDEVLYGGAAGGGKSYAQLLDALMFALKYKGSKQLILRKTFPELERSLIRTALELYPKEMYKYNTSKHTMVFKNGSTLDFGYCAADSDVHMYQSAEYEQIRFDEASHFSEYVLTYLGTRLRGANNYPKQIKYSSNPGGAGHDYLKKKFIDAAPWGESFTVDIEGVTQSRKFIPAKVHDNQFLLDLDPLYITRLKTQPEHVRKALLEGSWDIYEGLYFPEFDRKIHVVKPFDIPPEWRKYVVMDYGLDMFACYWIAIDNFDRSWVYREVYLPNQLISDAAKLILERTDKDEKIHQYLAPRDLWNRRQDTGKNVADIFQEYGIRLTVAPNKRIPGWMSVKEYLKVTVDEFGEPCAKLRIFENCVNLIRCVAAIQADPKDPVDVSDKPHELTHALDGLRYYCAARTQGEEKPIEPTPYEAQIVEEIQSFTSGQLYDVYGGSNGLYD